jgi:hypothetical protein
MEYLWGLSLFSRKRRIHSQAPQKQAVPGARRHLGDVFEKPVDQKKQI